MGNQGFIILLMYCLFLVVNPMDSPAQSAIVLEECGVTYVDPQDSEAGSGTGRDTLIYSTYFSENNELRRFYIDINAFGGSQTDRASVFAILPDSSRKPMGRLSFGECIDCVEGFALLYEDSLLTSSVTDTDVMDRWLQSLNQPSFTLSGNLQTLRGAGRISGTLPFCAVGMYVEFVVNSNPASTTTEFSAHVLCPEPEAACAVETKAQIDCQKDSVFLEALLPANCFSGPLSVSWRDAAGREQNDRQAAFPLSVSRIPFYLTVSDDCCTLRDTVWVENPAFAEAGEDRQLCIGDSLTLQGAGGVRYEWLLPGGELVAGQQLMLAGLNPAQRGEYILRAYNEEECEDTDTLRLEVRTPPEPQLQAVDACLGDTVKLEVQNDTAYVEMSWEGPSGEPLSSALIPGFQPSDAGLYTFRGKDMQGCAVRQTLEVTASAPPSFEWLVEESCDSARVFLFPDSLSYQWSNGFEGSPFVTGSGGVFALTITDANGCSSRSEIEIPEPNGPDFELEVEQPRCPTEAGRIEVEMSDQSRPAIFSIDGGTNYALSPVFEGLSPGTYEVAIQDELGCIQYRQVNIVAPDTLGVSLAQESLLVRPLTAVTLQARTVGNVQEYQWLPEEIDSGSPVTSFVARTDLDIRLIVRDDRGCLASTGFPLSIVLGTVYVPNAFTPNGDGANDRFTFYSDNGSGEIIESLQIFDRWGNLLFDTQEVWLNDESAGWDGTYNGKVMESGVMTYYGVVRFGNGVRKTYKGDVTLLR